MAGARGCPPAGGGERALAELLLEFSRAQYRAKDGGGGAASSAKVERIETRCLELFAKDYCYSLIQNVNGEICGHYPRQIVFLEYESTDRGQDVFESTVHVGKLQELMNRSRMARCRGRFVCPVILYKGKHVCRSATLAGWGELYGRTGYNYIFSGGSDDAWADPEDLSEEDTVFRNADSQLFDKVRGHDIKLLRYLSVRYICDLMVENKKVKFGLNVTSSEKVDKAQRYADFTLLSIPYPGCEFFKEYKDRDYQAEGLVFNWKQGYVDAPLSIPPALSRPLNIAWSEYQSWDLVQQTQNYLKLLISLINGDGRACPRLARACRDPVPDSGLRLVPLRAHAGGSAQQRGRAHRLRGVLRSQTAEEEEPAAWLHGGGALHAEKGRAASPQAVRWGRTPRADDRPPRREAKSSSSSSSGQSDAALRAGSSPLEVPKPRSVEPSLPGSSVSTDSGSWQLVTGCGSFQEHAALSADPALPCSFPDELPNGCLLVPVADRGSRLQEVRSAFLATYSSTIGLQALPPSPSSLGGLLEQFARGVGLRANSGPL
ncbi:phosphatidylinositol-3,5-bisphosphate 3-phosphatase MTMR14 isoform X7 [Pelodiscus sinensis]|uniref:phosphatidylinositol-3,5-bisphosphate 3-phosphatase MTMR14 isoform X7 n=1 Tax=Pelodiscus sinensis TaxID=13735 RepID=UPI003F6B650B